MSEQVRVIGFCLFLQRELVLQESRLLSGADKRLQCLSETVDTATLMNPAFVSTSDESESKLSFRYC